MSKKSVTAFVLAVVVAALCAGCVGTGGPTGRGESGSGGDRSGARVLASTTIWADIVSAVTCGRMKVPSLIPAGVDAHEFEPTVQDADTLFGADLVFVNGLGLEHSVEDTITAADQSGVQVVALAPKMDPIGKDPHVWMDPDRVAAVVPVIARHLEALGSSGLTRSELKACAAEYVSDLHQLSASIDTELASVPTAKRKLVTNHENLSYLADRFDLLVVGVLVPSTSSLGESDPRTLDELVATMKSAGVKSLFVDAVGTRRLADSLAERVGGGVRVKTLYVESLGRGGSGADTYVSMMATNGKRLLESLNR